MSVLHEKGERCGWLYNYYPKTVDRSSEDDLNERFTARSALVLLFQDHSGDTFFVNYFFKPYFLLICTEGHQREVELGLLATFGSLIHQITVVEKEDLGLINHLSGRKRACLKLIFENTSDLTSVRLSLEKVVKRNSLKFCENSVFEHTSLEEIMSRHFYEDGMHKSNEEGVDIDTSQWMGYVQDIREHDVKYHMQVSIDLSIFVGSWYDVSVREGEVSVTRCPDSKYAPATPRIVAFDIETTKAPLKFPQPEEDQIYMISYVLEGRGYLIVNRDIVTANISPFEYCPKEEYEGYFDTFNEVDEAATLRRFFDEMRKYSPNVYVTYNGDYFDFPFIHARSIVHGMNMRTEIGFSQAADGAFLNQQVPHLDCFYWVKRDSYLPQGSQGLKAVTKNKLGYEPIEVDPEDMLPLAQKEPQKMASYSVSDALSTWYLYLKYVHPFIYSLTTIIPMSPDDVLRKGSGGLCESLLMVQAHSKNVVYPNKKEAQLEKFHNGHLIDIETYIGGRVEALKSGVFRSDIPMQFHMNSDKYQEMIDDVENALLFSLTVENGVKKEEVENFEEVKGKIVEQLSNLRDRPSRMENPLIYHLDVGAMYPNIILTNRLQPYAIPSAEVCAGCCFNSPNNEHQCRRPMPWKWRGEVFAAGKYEFQRVKAQLENETFTQSLIEQTNLASVQKKAYGNRRGNVLENTKFERKREKGKSWKQSGGSGYRQESARMRREAAEAVIKTGGSSDDDSEGSDKERGSKAYSKLNEMTQFNMLKKRLGEYSRKVHGKIHRTFEVLRSNVVCQRENSFYVDTVRLFRDRRYEYKSALKMWKKKLSAATDIDEKKLCESRCVQMESLQLAHKCILNSFYGYVMRKGSRWYSMEMAGIVTYVGATLIQMARALVQLIGITLELDTDGIWCCLPQTFPDTFTFFTNNPSKPKVNISYPCIVLNKMVHDRYTNPQYQTLEENGLYTIRSENSIYFEVDGPYLAMLLPASREEGKSIKKRYAVFNPNGTLAELKGFELKRRGELMLIKDFQSQVFRRFLDGNDLSSSYASAAEVANASLDMLESKGEGYTIDEVLEKISESSNMTRRLSEYPESQKSLAITTARRIAEFLGPQMVKDKGLSCRFVISRLPIGRPVTERPIPVDIFRADPVIRAHFIRKWTGDSSFSSEVDLEKLLDWEYYTARFSACVQKIITIPAALQSIPNPVPRVQHPDWLHKRVQRENSKFRQLTLTGMLKKGVGERETRLLPDVEDLARHSKPVSEVHVVEDKEDSDWASDAEQSETEALMEREAREAQLQNESAVEDLNRTYFSLNHATVLDDSFFAASGARLWLERQKEKWMHRAALRKELSQTKKAVAGSVLGDKGTHAMGTSSLDSHFIDLTSQAMTLPWEIVEVRTPKDDTDVLNVLAVLDQKLYTLQVRVPRYVFINTEASLVLPSFVENATAVQNYVLPRREKVGKLYQVLIPPGQQGEKLLNELSILEGVREIFETHISREESLFEKIGCSVQVNGPGHIRRTQVLPVNKRNIFSMSDLNRMSATEYMSNKIDRNVFIFHVVVEQRGLLCLVNHKTSNALVIFVQATSAPLPNINWSKLCEETRSKLNSTLPELHVNVQAAPQVANAWRIIYQQLAEMQDGPLSPLLCVLHSSAETNELLQQRFLPSTLPYLRILGATEDEKLLADPFRWSRLLSRRFLQRYYSSMYWIEERVGLSRIAGIPMCNIRQDSCVHVLDVLYSRALHSRSHVLWCNGSPEIAHDTAVERPRDVVLPGGFYTWCVEFSLSRLDVVAILFSQVIQDSNDHAALSLCDRGVSSHFNILRDLIADLFGKAVEDVVADTVLRHVTRWMRDPISSTYEPRLVEMLSGLSHSVLTAVLLRLAKLGGKTVKVSSSSLLVLTPKHSLQESVMFADFVSNGVKDQPMLTLLSLRALRFLVPTIIMDHRDFGSFSISASNARKYLANKAVSVDQLSPEFHFSFFDCLPGSVKEMLLKKLTDVFLQIFNIVQEVVEEASNDPSLAVAVKSEFIVKRIKQRVKSFIKGKVQEELLVQVDQLIKIKDLYTENEKKVMSTAESYGYSVLNSNRLVAIEYTKSLCKLFGMFDAAAVEQIRNNCLRLCGVSPFSSKAQLVVAPLISSRIHSIICSFCSSTIDIDLSEHMGQGTYSCPQCAASIPAASVEAHLVRYVNTLVRQKSQEDFRCSRCHEVTAMYMAENCCDSLEGIFKVDAEELKALSFYAELQGFSWLKEAVQTALLCV